MAKPKFNVTNDNIEWAKYTWNPVTGCNTGCPYCLHPETIITMSNGEGRYIKDLKIGDNVLGMKNGEYITSIVNDIWKTKKESCEIILKNGNKIICSEDHRFLGNRGGWKYVTGDECGKNKRPHLTLNNYLKGMENIPSLKKHISYQYMLGYVSGMINGDGMLRSFDYSGKRRNSDKQYQFRLAMNDSVAVKRTEVFLAALNVDVNVFSFNEKMKYAIRTSKKENFDKLLKIANNFIESFEFSRGYLAAAYDSDGSQCGGKLLRIFKSDLTHIENIKKSFDIVGIKYIQEKPRIPTNKIVQSIRIVGGMNEYVKFFSICDPAIDRKRKISGKIMIKDGLKIVSIKKTDKIIEMFDISTSTENFIANGVVSHNCYAKDIAMRFTGHFNPEFHEERLSAPENTTPRPGEPNNVFVCSMADLFGDWVPAEWILKVFESCRKNPQWNFLFLTKNPKRYLEFVKEFPDNSWIGATADTAARGIVACDVFNELKWTFGMNNIKFLSCEPLRENVRISSAVDWVIIGGQSKTSGAPEMQPDWKWVESLIVDAEELSIPYYFKPNLTVRPKYLPV